MQDAEYRNFSNKIFDKTLYEYLKTEEKDNYEKN